MKIWIQILIVIALVCLFLTLALINFFYKRKEYKDIKKNCHSCGATGCVLRSSEEEDDKKKK